jgi:tetratricopeptide (TPR) repeat protein
MDLERWLRTEHLYHAALERDESERASFLIAACAGDEGLRHDVESLLAHQDQAAAFLEAPALEVAAKALAQDQAAGRKVLSSATAAAGGDAVRPCDPDEASLVGERIGPYLLVEVMGQGGMGTVYRATRDDDQFHQEVAIKLIRPGIASGGLLRRFRDERQILATLEHSNIARLLDGGVSAGGLSYLVMEFVDGEPISRYCRHKKLTIGERLELFRTVCSAVHFAHQHLVVHRDIKPANILVTTDGVAKLLDFGIAKILDPSSAALSSRTTFVHPMTPDYASPEQVRGKHVTTTSDVYSLGALLYELLTDQRPYQVGSLDELIRAVCEQEPVKPSVCVSRAQVDGGGRSFSSRRRELAGDLDAITLKAMRKEPGERYGSAEELSADVARYLDGLPVAAHRGSFRYIARKFVARHRVGVLTGVVAAVLSVAGVAAIVREAQVASLQQARAQQRFNDVRKLANSLMFEVNDGIAELPGSTSVRKLLVTRGLEYLDALAAEARDDSALQLELATAYQRVGDVQGNYLVPNLGDSKAALTSYEKARGILTSVVASDPSMVEARVRLAGLYVDLSAFQFVLRNPADALASARQGLSAWESIAQRWPGEERSRRGLASAHFRMAMAIEEQDPREAVSIMSKTLDDYTALLDAHPDGTEEQRSVALAHKMLCAWLQQEHNDQALEHCLSAVDLDRRRATAHPNDSKAKLDLAFSLSETGSSYTAKGDLEGALKTFRTALSIREKLAEADPHDMRTRSSLVYPHLAIGGVLFQMNQMASAIDDFEQAAAIAEDLVARDPSLKGTREYAAQARTGIADAEMQLAKNAGPLTQKAAHHRRACASYQRAVQGYRENEQRGGFASDFERRNAQYVAQKAAACGT